MQTLADIALAACQVLGIDDTATVTQAKVFARNRWTMLWSAELWPQSRTLQNVTLLAGQAQVTLVAPLELPTLVRRADNGMVLPAESEVAAMLSDPGAYTDLAATPLNWCQIAPVAGRPVLRFSSAPIQNLALTVIGKAECPSLAVDTDKPTIPGSDLALIAHVTADLYEWQRQMGKAQMKRQEAVALQLQMSDLARIQSGSVVRIVPDEPGDWGCFPYSKN